MRAARALHARCLGLVVRAKLLRGGAFLVICPRIFCLILVLAHFLPAIFDLFVLAVCPRTLCTVQDKYQLLGMIKEFCKRVYSCKTAEMPQPARSTSPGHKCSMELVDRGKRTVAAATPGTGRHDKYILLKHLTAAKSVHS